MAIIQSGYSNEVSATPLASTDPPDTGYEWVRLLATDLSLSEGAAVSAWPDTGINAYSSSIMGSPQPVFRENIGGGGPGVEFSTSNGLRLTVPDGEHGNPNTIVMAWWDRAAGATNARMFLSGQVSVAANRFEFRYVGTSGLGYNDYSIVRGANPGQYGPVGGDYSTLHVLTIDLSSSSTDNNEKLYKNKSLFVEKNFGTAVFRLGVNVNQNNSGAERSSMTVGGLVILKGPTRAASVAAAAEWEDYFMNLYGLS